MEQIVEGVDNEVALILFFTTTAVAFIVPLYVARIFYPRQQHGADAVVGGGGGNNQSVVRQTETNTQNNDVNNDNSSEREAESSNLHNRLDSSNQNSGHPIENIVEQSRQDNTVPTNTTSSSTMSSSSNSQNDLNTTGTSNKDDINTEQNPSQQDSYLLKVKVQETSYEQSVTENTTLLELKRKFFPEQFNEGKQIRFVYAGRVLTGDEQPLKQFGITGSTVMQCVITDSNTERTTTNTGSGGGGQGVQQDADLDLSIVLYVFFGGLLIGSWIMIFWFDNLFSNLGVALLSILSVVGYFMLQ